MADLSPVLGGALSGAAAGSAFGPIGAGVGGVIGAGAGILQSQQSDKVNKAIKDQAKKQEELLAQLMAIGIPEEEALKVVFQRYPMPQEFTPTELNLPTMEGTELAKVKYPEEMAQIEREALTKYRDISAQGGMDAQARAAYEMAAQEANQREQAQRQAIEMGMARRGLSDSGMAAVQQQMAMQNNQDRARMEAMQQAAEAQRRALEAVASGASLAGKMGSRETDLAMQKAQAQDIINRFNVGQRSQTAQQNWQAQNQAKQDYLNKLYGAQTSNVDLANKEMAANATIPERMYNMQVGRVTGAMAPTAKIGDLNTQVAQNKAATTAAGIQAGIGGATALGNYYQNQELIDALKKQKSGQGDIIKGG